MGPINPKKARTEIVPHLEASLKLKRLCFLLFLCQSQVGTDGLDAAAACQFLNVGTVNNRLCSSDICLSVPVDASQ
jgi:hypothetical protein